MPSSCRPSRDRTAKAILLSFSIIATIVALAISVYVAMEYRGMSGKSIGYIHGWIKANYTIPPGIYRVETSKTVDLGSVILESNVSGRLEGHTVVRHSCFDGAAEMRGVSLSVVETVPQQALPVGYNLTVYGDGVLLAWVSLNPSLLNWNEGEAMVDSGAVSFGGFFDVASKGLVSSKGDIVVVRVYHYLSPRDREWTLPENITIGANLDDRVGSFAVAVSIDYACVETINVSEGLIMKTRLPVSGELDAGFSGDLGLNVAGLSVAVAVASLASVLAALSAGLSGCKCVDEEPPGSEG